MSNQHHGQPARITRARLSVPQAGHARFTHTVGTYPAMRMPGNLGGIHLDTAEFDPSGGLTALAGTWCRYLRPVDTADGDVVVQLLVPEHDPTARDRADLYCWLTRAGHWQRMRTWSNVGPGWPHDLAPLLHAALPAVQPQPASHDG